ncbi:MAG TPA: hypothetical protein VLJ76_02470 [Gaiellaceae bacterium]|nr:hypothetical protein [Gaiellaceae bacterium]
MVVVVGGSVTWSNTGKQPHRIASDSRAWRNFTLKPAGRQTIAFKRAGRFFYHRDGIEAGLVVVGGGGGGGAGGKPIAEKAWVGTFTSNGTSAGTQTCGAHWSGTLQFTIDAGKVKGRGEALQTGRLYCTVKLATQVKHVTFTVDGTEETPAGEAPSLELHMHPLRVEPLPSYDAGGFLLHFGQRGEGEPIRVVQYEPGKIGGDWTLIAIYGKTTVGLDDRYELKPP